MLSDEETTLWRNILAGDDRSFALFYDRYWLRMYKAALYYLRDKSASEEVVQEVFLNIWNKRETLDIQDFSAYLNMTTRYEVFRRLKTTKRSLLEFNENSSAPKNVDYNYGYVRLDELDNTHALENCLKELPKRCREIFYMSKIQQLSNSEIATQLGISKHTVENQLAVALRHLKLNFARVALLVCMLLSLAVSGQTRARYDVAAFLYPAYASGDPRLRPFWPSGIGEWETVVNMQERYPGHYWNRKPLWGTVNEADPAVMSMEIDQAAGHGVDVFIFDWYWYDGRPFMETTLDSGFLRAANRDKMKFYLMWANHDVNNYWDTRLFKYHDDNVVWQGSVDRSEFEKICKRNIEKYFKLPQYYRIDGKPVFMIYDLPNLVKGLGGIQQTIDALAWFRDETKRAGFPGLDLQFTMWESNFNFSGFDASKGSDPKSDMIKKLGFTSATHYQFAHFVNVNDDYLTILEAVQREWARIDSGFHLPYYPHISIGWDNSPRTGKSAVVRNNTPANFEKGLRMAKAYVDAHPGQAPLITINSWNEWTETSYLEPDNVNGYGYLEAVKRVFVQGR